MSNNIQNMSSSQHEQNIVHISKHIQKIKFLNIWLCLSAELAISVRKLEVFNLMTTSSHLPLAALDVIPVLVWPLGDLFIGEE